MNIRQKMLLGAAVLTLIPVALTSLLIWQGASTLAADTVGAQLRTQLVSLRDTKRQQITDELNERVASLQVLAAQRSTIDAYKQMKGGFYTSGKELSKTIETNEATKNLNDYITQYFSPEYAKRNPGAAPSLTKAVASLDANAIALQTVFIVDNPSPAGSKEQMDTPTVDFAYGRAHAQFHAGFEKAQKLSGYYDIFMIDAETDTVIYSVFKELDFATKLSGDGIASKTKLAEAYLKMKEAKAGSTYLSDFAPYLASYDDQAAFVAVPIYDGGKQIGVLAMQYPIDKLTESLSANKAWKSIGLGDTGDIFMVGNDKLMRTNARYLLEDKASFVTLLGDKLNAISKGLLDKKNTTIGLVKIDSDATRAAIEGKEGVVDFVDYRGIASIGAYAPVRVQGLNWGIVAKIDTAEANQPIDALDRSSLLRALLIAVAVVLVAGVGVTVFLRQFLAPITKLSDTVKAVAGGETTARSQLVEKDEIGDLGRAFDDLLDERNAALAKATQENETINNSAIGLLQGVFQLSNKDLTARAPVTEDIVGTISASVNQLADEIGSTLADVRGVADEVRRTSASLQEQSRFVETRRCVSVSHSTQCLKPWAVLPSSSTTWLSCQARPAPRHCVQPARPKRRKQRWRARYAVWMPCANRFLRLKSASSDSVSVHRKFQALWRWSTPFLSARTCCHSMRPCRPLQPVRPVAVLRWWRKRCSACQTAHARQRRKFRNWWPTFRPKPMKPC